MYLASSVQIGICSSDFMDVGHDLEHRPPAINASLKTKFDKILTFTETSKFVREGEILNGTLPRCCICSFMFWRKPDAELPRAR